LDSLLSSWKKQREVDDEYEEENMNTYRTRMAQKRQADKDAEQSNAKRSRAADTSGKMFVIDRDTGEPRLGTPSDSLWWINYVLHPELMTKRMHNKFRRRFRMPFEAWKHLVDMMNEHELFSPWHRGSTDVCNNPASPIELLCLGALRYLGRKCTFDCIEELTFISERTQERFFAKFIEYGATFLYDTYVVAPQTPEEAERHMFEMKLAGFNGALGSMDATHVVVENCRFGLRQIHLGHKLKQTARTYNIIVNHRRRILSSTGGHPSRWNDKTLVLFDTFLEDIKSGKILSDNEFILYEYTDNGEVVAVTYKGVWIQVDNGYLTWSLTVPPFKYCNERKELRWSQWMESMRKDVECTFGILKKRFTILSKGVHARDINVADKVWKTCCGLHNMLLEWDGFDEMWEGEIPSDPDDTSCFAIGRLHGDDSESNVDEFVQRKRSREDRATIDAPLSDVVRDIRNLSLDEMRAKLVDHFDILFHDHGIVWPTRVQKPRSV